jgi:cobaltochelatase CobS
MDNDIMNTGVIVDTETSTSENETVAFGKVTLEMYKPNPEDIRYVPTSEEYIDNKKILEKVAIGIKANLPMLFIGHTGVGKTSAIRYLASRVQAPYRRLNMNGNTTADEFVGKTLINREGTYWIDGVLLDAMRRGHWLVIDEVNAALAEILFVLQSVLDDDRFVVLAEKDGEVVRPHKNFRLFATMNPSEYYAGTKVLNQAFLSRFTMTFRLGMPSEAEERKMVLSRFDNLKVVTPEKLTSMIKFANNMRTAYFKGAHETLISPRETLAWVKMSELLGDITQGAEYTFVNRADEQEAASLRDLLKLSFGMSIMDYIPACRREREYSKGDKVVISKPKNELFSMKAEEMENVFLVQVVDVRKEEGEKIEDHLYTVKVIATNVRVQKDENWVSIKGESNIPLGKMATSLYNGEIV